MTNKKYNFSYTGFSLRVREMNLIATIQKNKKPLDLQYFGNGKTSTGKKWYNEINKRLKTLTPSQINILREGDLTMQRQIGFLSVCKAHLFVRDFTIEVIREKFLLYDYQLTEGEYISFFRRKADLMPGLDNLKETTQKKVKQVTFKILEQAGIIDNVKEKMIQPQIIDTKVIRAIAEENKEWLKVLLLSEAEIAKINL